VTTIWVIRARVRADGIETDVSPQSVGDSALNAQIDAAYQAKNGNQGSSPSGRGTRNDILSHFNSPAHENIFLHEDIWQL